MRLALLAIPAVRSALSLEIGRDIEYHAAIATTQERARALAAAGSGSTVVVADHQTAGQGTRGRSWEDPVGMSLLGLGGAATGAAAGDAMEETISGIPRDELYVYEDALRRAKLV